MTTPAQSPGRLIRIGTAGWSYKDWDGIVYPPQLKKEKHPVEYLAQYFDLIEINTSFYGHIRPEWGKLWCRKAAAVNPEFIFTAKLNKAFTHSPIAVLESTSASTIRPGGEDERLAKQGLDSIAGEGMLGALLMQFPISFKNTNENRDYLESLLQRFHEYPLAVEVRHDSWANENILRYFIAKGVAFCNIDQPKLGKSIGPTEHVTSGIAYVRLHGRNYDQWFEHEKCEDRYNYLYTETELAGWKDKVENIAQKANVTFVVANNHFQGKAAVNALELKYMITRKPVKAPDVLVSRYPELESIVSRGTGDFALRIS
ncbi:MAG TPA: DUF72 domain-containing protein [Terriglobales bacterium]|nr:DUF72 domain-containing protein [Terriglobales bacterium]